MDDAEVVERDWLQPAGATAWLVEPHRVYLPKLPEQQTSRPLGQLQRWTTSPT